MNKNFLSQLREKAHEGIAKRIFADADNTDAELRKLADMIATKCEAVPVYGPIKQQARAAEKVANDYGGDWYGLKDVVRMTIVAPTLSSLRQVQSLIREECVARNGLSLLKDVEVFANSSPCGYSGMNFVISMSNGRPAEIQANIPEVMYGQLNEKNFRGTVGEEKFNEIKGRYRVEGGLGHGLYEIYRVSPGSVKAKHAALISKQYFDYLRGFPTWTATEELQRELAAIIKANPTIFHS